MLCLCSVIKIKCCCTTGVVPGVSTHVQIQQQPCKSAISGRILRRKYNPLKLIQYFRNATFSGFLRLSASSVWIIAHVL